MWFYFCLCFIVYIKSIIHFLLHFFPFFVFLLIVPTFLLSFIFTLCSRCLHKIICKKQKLIFKLKKTNKKHTWRSACFFASKSISRILSRTVIYPDISSPICSCDLKKTKRATFYVFNLAPCEVYIACFVAKTSVSSYFTFPPLPFK